MNNTLRCEIHLEYKIDQTADVLIAEFEADTSVAIQGTNQVATSKVVGIKVVYGTGNKTK